MPEQAGLGPDAVPSFPGYWGALEGRGAVYLSLGVSGQGVVLLQAGGSNPTAHFFVFSVNPVALQKILKLMKSQVLTVSLEKK